MVKYSISFVFSVSIKMFAFLKDIHKDSKCYYNQIGNFIYVTNISIHSFLLLFLVKWVSWDNFRTVPYDQSRHSQRLIAIINDCNSKWKQSFKDIFLSNIIMHILFGIYDKRDDFGFPIVNFPWFGVFVPSLQYCGCFCS